LCLFVSITKIEGRTKICLTPHFDHVKKEFVVDTKIN
jgi:hypothetical protein